MDHPLIISGWNNIVDYYNLESEVVLWMRYYGDDNFTIHNTILVSSQSELQQFHSRYVFYRDIYAFDVTLTLNNISLPELVEYWQLFYFFLYIITIFFYNFMYH